MENLFIILIIISITIGCKNTSKTDDNIGIPADISDLEMSAEMQKIYSARRGNLISKTGSGIVILRSDYGFDGGRHEYRAADNFYYLTGFAQPGSALMLSSDKEYPFILYYTERSIIQEIYSGGLPRSDVIMNTFQSDTVLPITNIPKVLEESLRTGNEIYIDFNDQLVKDDMIKLISKINASDKLIKDLTPILNELRVHKHENEIARIQKAVDITGEAFINACHICRPDMYEFEVEAIIEYIFGKDGCDMPGFGSIVASGANAVTLHYSSNDRKMENGDLLLMDIGAEYGYYCADITRTIPVNGKFGKEQKEIYELVLEAQKAAIDEMIPGNYLVAGNNKSTEIIAQGLFELGLITDLKRNWQKKFYFLYPISHYLGMNVHDVGDYGAHDTVVRQNIAINTTYGRLLEKGMVLTVEPGLYFRSNGLSQLFELYGKEATNDEIREYIDKVTPVYEKYKNIGVRIEDDVLITDSGNVILSKNIPKEIDELERIMSRRNKIK